MKTVSKGPMRRVGQPKGSFSALGALVLFLSLSASTAPAATLKQVTDFGNNPSNIKMYLYVPDKVVAKPPILVGLHWCHGTAPAFHTGTQFAAQADKYGFIIVYPNANSSDSCWDVHSQAALKHDGGGDPSGIVSMVRYVVKNHNGDSDRVYAAGHSSGGMMTNVMLGSYPDVFKAGASFAGVPFACFSGANSWNSDCAGGKISKTPEAWGDLVRAAYPGYTGARPRMQLWHGTNDDVLSFNNFGEAIKQWTNVLGVSQTATSTEANTPQSTWTRTRYADASGNVRVEAIREQGQPHNLQIVADKAVQFLGLDGSSTGLEGGSRDADKQGGSGTPVRVTRIASPGSLRFTVVSPPGRVGLSLRDAGGKEIRAWAGMAGASGSLDVTLDSGADKGGLPGAGVYLLSAKVDGYPAGSSRFAWLAD